MRTIYELTEAELDELRQSLYFQFLDNDDDILEEISDFNDIPFSILENHYSDVMFTEDDFFINQNN